MRPAARIFSGVALLVMAGVAAAAFWGLPAFLRARSAELLAAQLRMEVKVGGAGLTRDGVRLTGVAVDGGAGLPRVQVQEIRAAIPLRALLGRGEPPLRRLEAQGVEILLADRPAPAGAPPPGPLQAGTSGPAAGPSASTEEQAAGAASPSAGAPEAGASAAPRTAGEAPGGDAAAAGGARSLPPRPAGLLRRAVRLLASDASIHLRDVGVRDVTDPASASLIGGLRLDLTRTGPGRFHLDAATPGGAEPFLSASLDVEPDLQWAVGRLEFRRLPVRLAAALAPGLPLDRDAPGWLDGRVDLVEAGPEALAMSGRLSLSDVTVRSAALASRPVRDVGIDLAGEGVLRPAARRLEVTRAEARLEDAQIEVSGALEWTDAHYLIHLLLSLPPTTCNAAAAAIPRDVLGELAGFSWEGALEGSLLVHLDSRALREAGLEISLEQNCRFVSVPDALAVGGGRSALRQRVRTADGVWHERPVGPGTPGWTPLAQVSPYLVQAVLAHEDAGFFDHGGFSAADIRAALVQNIEAGRYRFGASTITMQLARNLYLDREKTLARKIQEVLLTWYLETALDKREILELYLNIVDYGPDLVGVRRGAQHYFGRDPARLTPAQAAFLACILPAPHRYHRHVQAGEMPPSLASEMEELLRQMARRGSLSEPALRAGLAEAASLRFSREAAGAQLR